MKAISERSSVDARNYYLDTAADEALRLATRDGVAPNVDLIVHTTLEPRIQDAARANAVKIIAKKQADGTVQTPRVTYGKNGLMPPM